MYQLLKLLKQFLVRSEEHTSELQSHSEISYAVFCLKKKKQIKKKTIPRRESTQHTTPDHTVFSNMLVGASICGSVLFSCFCCFFFFFNDTATTEIYTNLNTLSLHDALPICHIQKSRMSSSACDRSEERRVG